MQKVLRLSEEQLLARIHARVLGKAVADVAAGQAPRVSGAACGAAAASATGSGNKPAVGKRQKYGNQKTVVDGEMFDSRAEAKRYQALKLMLKAGEIVCLERQVSYVLIPSQKKADGSSERACVYKSDFEYVRDGKLVVEDVKGMRTKDYVIKRKLMLHIHGIEITEIVK